MNIYSQSPKTATLGVHFHFWQSNKIFKPIATARKQIPNIGRDFHPVYRSAFDRNEERVRYSLGLKRCPNNIGKSNGNTYVYAISFWLIRATTKSPSLH